VISVQQTVHLLAAGYSAAELDSQDLVAAFGGRVRSAVESLRDRGTLTLTFLDAGGDEIRHVTIEASNTTDRWELIGDLADWSDTDSDRLFQGGNEDVLYESLPSPYKPKNAPFDSMQELRLVNGWHRDDVWERYGQHLTIYGSGKVNVNTAEREVLMGLLRAYVTPATPTFLESVMQEIDLFKSLATYSNARAFVQHLESLGATVDSRLQNAVTTESNVFLVTSTGQVGDAVVTIEAVLDFSRSQLGQVVYWRIR
jgi:type II secretory pathway component PulK